MQCRKNVSNTSHFRTIAPKIEPKVVTSCSSSSYPVSFSDIAVSGVGTKPVVMQTQNYALMKVAGHDGTFSLVALPQVSPQITAPLMQTTNIPLKENLKLPIPRYQSSRNKKVTDQKAKVSSLYVLNKLASEKQAAQRTCSHSETILKSATDEDVRISKPAHLMVTEEVIPEASTMTPGLFPVKGVDPIKVHKTALPYIEKCLPKALCTGSPIKLCADAERTTSSSDNGSLVGCGNAKVSDSAKSLTILSPVVFGSPVHLVPSVPKGKLPILPYSKMKKCIFSKCNAESPADNCTAEPCKEPFCVKTSSRDFASCMAAVAVSQASLAESPLNSDIKANSDNLIPPNGVFAKRRGRKRKVSSEIMGIQSKMKLVGSKLIVCKDKVKVNVFDGIEKKAVSMKKYRSIMPKPSKEVQTLALTGSSASMIQAQTTNPVIRNKFSQIRPNRWKQNDGIVMKLSSDCKSTSLVAKGCHKCHICDHNFQFKHHLQDHLNTHTNRRPYHCRLCRKAYMHSGSLSTHMKLHHSESRLKKLMCCEFCAKVFGHIRVYFGHLKEVHRVIISTEMSAGQPSKIDVIEVRKESTSIEREEDPHNDEDSVHGHTEEIKLQIKCGRCLITKPTFSDMKLHLLIEHGDKFQEQLQGGVLESRQGAQEEMVKDAAHYWKMLNERRNVVKCCRCEEEFSGSVKLRKHMCFSQLDPTVSLDEESLKSTEVQENKQDNSLSVSSPEVHLWCEYGLNCILCKHVFKVKDELLTHWRQQHKCEDPSILWDIFSLLPKKD
ncbi:zinc finger protein 438 [Rhinophrynus dorsalis]